MDDTERALLREAINHATREWCRNAFAIIGEQSGDIRGDKLAVLKTINDERSIADLPPIPASEVESFPGELT